MNDQAATVEALQAPRAQATVPSGRPTLVVGSGKGGVGKSVVAVLLAERMARQGRRVLLVDGSQNLGNLHVLLGIQRGSRLEHLIAGAITPRDLLIPVHDRLWLVPADSGAESVHALAPVDRARLHHRLTGLFDDFEAVVVDAGGGIEGVVRAATMRATRLIVVTVPEPAALSDAYATIKIVMAQVRELPVDVLVNRVSGEREGAEAFERLATATRQFLPHGVSYLGALWEDEVIRRLVRAPGRLVAGLGPGRNDDVLTTMLQRLDPPAAVVIGG
ncbi:MAG TPA: AAA family ATPase [Gemmatimonadales bacterium]|nr:AAA family ATPase [Gemmatimonadales bacterium]